MSEFVIIITFVLIAGVCQRVIGHMDILLKDNSKRVLRIDDL